MLYKFTRPDGITVFKDGSFQSQFQYPLPQGDAPGEWVLHPNPARKPDGKDCGPGRLHFMKVPFPTYAPWPYLCHEAEPGGMLVGESAEKAGYTACRLLRTLTDEELDALIESEFQRRFHMADLYAPIAWARRYQPFTAPVRKEFIVQQLTPLCALLGKNPNMKIIKPEIDKEAIRLTFLAVNPEANLWAHLEANLLANLWANLRASLEVNLLASLRASLMASLLASLRASLQACLQDSLQASIRVSLWTSLFYDTGFRLAARPVPALQGLLGVWKAGACPIGFDKNTLMVIAKQS